MTSVSPVNARGSAAAFRNDDFPDDNVPAGQFGFYTRYGDDTATKRGLLFGCPCGCGTLQSVHFAPHLTGGPAWNWNGDEAQPSLTPSINILQTDAEGNRVGEHWHGFLTNGVFVSC